MNTPAVLFLHCFASSTKPRPYTVSVIMEQHPEDTQKLNPNRIKMALKVQQTWFIRKRENGTDGIDPKVSFCDAAENSEV